MKKGNHLKTLLYTLIAVLLLTAAMNPIQLPVDEVLQGVELSLSDPTQAKPVTLSLKGDYGWKIFGEDELDLRLEMTELPQTRLEFYAGSSTLKIGVVLPPYESNLPLTYTLYGDLCFTPFETRKELILLCTPKEGTRTDEGGRYFVFPADDRESALALLQRYDKESYTRFAAVD